MSLLENKAVVALLGIGAVGACAYNLAPLFDDGAVDLALDVPPVGLIGEVATQSAAPGPSVRHDPASGVATASDATQRFDNIGFKLTPSRDPFSFASPTEMAELPSVDSVEEISDEPVVVVPDPTVAAVVLARDFRVAVVNGEIVGRGSALASGHRLETIRPAGVEISGNDGAPKLISVSRDP